MLTGNRGGSGPLTSRGRSLIAVLLTAALGTAVLVAIAPEASAAVAAPANGVLFNDPFGGKTARTRIATRVIELINGAEAGSAIRVASYYATDTAVPNALVAAKQRGVNVQVVMDERVRDTPAMLALFEENLGTDVSAPSWFLTCGPGRACIASSIMHNKFFLLTRTLGKSNVILQSSANLSGDTRDSGKGWNDLVTVVGNDDLFDAYSGYFGDLAARHVDNNYYDTRPPVQSGADKVSFFPRAQTDGLDPANDPSEDSLMEILNSVSCTGNETVGTADGHRTIIRITVMSMDLSYLGVKLAELDAAGCDVDVAVRFDPNSGAQRNVLRSLLARTDSPYGGPKVSYYCYADPRWIHAKNMSIEGNVGGRGDRQLVWMGSFNHSRTSLRDADEVLLQLEDDAIFSAYRNNHDNAVVPNATHHPANGDEPVC